MGERFPGGVISKTPPTVTGPSKGSSGSASGVWTLTEVLGYQKAGTWPGQPLPFDYELYAWGNNVSGQMGDGSVVYRSSPVQIGSLTTWSQVSANYKQTSAIKDDGTLWTWGINNIGQLGLGDVVARSSPVQVGALTNWSYVSGGVNFNVARKTDGTIWSWGANNNGELGINEFPLNHRSSPVQIGALTTWAQIVAGGRHVLAVRTNGTLWAWGRNNQGQLGTNNRVYASSPVQIGALTTWQKVFASTDTSSHSSFSVRTNGTLWSWGYNNRGQLGHGNVINRSQPIQVGVLTNWSEVSCGNQFANAIKTDGTLWGMGLGGSIGDGTVVSRSSPVQIGALTDWAQVSCGSAGTLSVKTDGTLWGWGSNSSGELGLNNTTQYSSPVQVGSLLDWYQVSVRWNTSAAITKS